MRRSRSSALVLLLALGAGQPLAAQSSPSFEGGGALFLLFPLGARATATGQSAVADGGTSEALYWNPAGLAPIHRSEAALLYYNRGIFGTGTALVIALPSSGFGTLAFGAYIAQFGEDDVVPPQGGGPIGKILTRNISLNAAFATQVAFGVDAGIAYKLIQFRVDCSGDCASFPTAVGTTHAVDLGLRYAFTSVPIEVGFAVRHLGFKLQINNSAQADPLPTRVVAGVRGTVVRPDSGDGMDVRLMGDVVAPVGPSSSNPYLVMGIDGGVRDIVRLRAGYAFVSGQQGGPSLGLGVHVGRVNVDLARAFDSGDDLGEREPIHLSIRLAL